MIRKSRNCSSAKLAGADSPGENAYHRSIGFRQRVERGCTLAVAIMLLIKLTANSEAFNADGVGKRVWCEIMKICKWCRTNSLAFAHLEEPKQIRGDS
jgi:hypothetical protein